MFEKQSTTIPLLAGEQEFHCSEPNPFVAHAVDEVDNDRGGDQTGAASDERWVEKMISEPGVHRDFVAVPRSVRSCSGLWVNSEKSTRTGHPRIPVTSVS